jgi:hypothetical protein
LVERCWGLREGKRVLVRWCERGGSRWWVVVVKGPLFVNGGEVVSGSLGRSYQCLCPFVRDKKPDNRL